MTDAATLAARALRKIGVAIVADADRSAAQPTQTAAQIADNMLRQMGIVVSEASRPAALGVVSQSEIAARALRALGVNPMSGPWPASDPYTAAAVAEVVLTRLGVTVPVASQPAAGAPVSLTQVAARALEALGVNPAPLTAGIGTGTTFTIADVANAALLKLAVIASDETPSTTDAAYALEHANAVHDALVANDYVTWGYGAIPAAAFEFYVIMTASLIGGAFGKTTSAEAYAQAQVQIRTLALSGAAGQALAEARASTVHEELLAQGIVSWSGAAVPAAEAEHYVRMTAILLAPVYRTLTAQDVAADRQAYIDAIGMVRRDALLRDIEPRAIERVSVVHAELSALGFVTWDIDLIPASLVEHYATLTEATMVAEGGKELDPSGMAAVKARIRDVALSGALGQALAEARVAAVHDELNRLALVSWAITAIPVGVADYYVVLTTTKLWPIYKSESANDREANAKADGLALAALKRAAFIEGALTRAIERVGVVHAELNDIGLVNWPVTAIPASVSDCYMAMASSKMTAEGGQPLTNPEYASWVQRVRMVAMGGPAGQALAEQKVRAVHYSLEAKGRVRWTLFDIPSFAEEPYVFLAATLLGPECEVKVDPAWAVMAERDLMRIVSLPSAGEPVTADYF